MRRAAAILLGLVLVSGVVGACASDQDSGATAQLSEEEAPAAQGEDGYLSAPQEKELGRVSDTGTSAGGGGSSVGGVSAARPAPRVGEALLKTPGIAPSVIKTADVEVEVSGGDFQDALNQSISLAGRHGGFIVSTTVDDAKKRSGTVVLRVPAEEFERVLASLEGLGEVQSEVISGRDVSQEFIDLDARIRNYESQEAVLLRLMAETNTIDESIRVQHELQSIRLEIERLKGRLRYLRNQAAMSTISMRLVEVGVVPGDPPKIGVLGKAWDRAVAGALAVVAAVIVGAGVLFPIALMIAIGFVILRLLRPKFGSAV